MRQAPLLSAWLIPGKALTYHVYMLVHTLISRSMPQVGAGKRVFQLMDRVPQLPPSGSQKPTGSPAGAALDFQAVSFAYPSRPTSWVLKDFDLQVMASRTV
jgi:ABC-type multidrug transport system fused ATPase/permease subunit